jgi:hypothetical protein
MRFRYHVTATENMVLLCCNITRLKNSDFNHPGCGFMPEMQRGFDWRDTTILTGRQAA